MKNLCLIAVLISLTAILGCDFPMRKGDISAPGFEIKDSTARWVENHVWIDDERVLFIGLDENNFRIGVNGKTDGQHQRMSLYVWNVKTNTIEPRDPEIGEYITNLCAYNGNVGYSGLTYEKLVDGRVKKIDKIKYGPLGKESLETKEGIVGEDKNRNEEQIRINPFDCKPYNVKDLPSYKANVYPLHEDHGYLIRKRDKNNLTGHKDQPLILLSKDKKTEVTLPIESEYGYPAQYSPFNNTYLLHGAHAAGPRKRVWTVTPDGKSTEFGIPAGMWFKEGAYTIYQIKSGILIRSYNWVAFSNKQEYVGMYLFSDNKVKKVLTGLVERISISPDGCKVAFDHPIRFYGPDNTPQDRVNGVLPHALKMIDFCNPKKDHPWWKFL